MYQTIFVLGSSILNMKVCPIDLLGLQKDGILKAVGIKRFRLNQQKFDHEDSDIESYICVRKTHCLSKYKQKG